MKASNEKILHRETGEKVKITVRIDVFGGLLLWFTSVHLLPKGANAWVDVMKIAPDFDYISLSRKEKGEKTLEVFLKYCTAVEMDLVHEELYRKIKCDSIKTTLKQL